MDLTTVSLFISLSLVVFGIAYYYFTTRHKERMMMLSRGLSPDYFKGQTDYLPILLILGTVSVVMAPAIILGGYLVEMNAFRLKGSLVFFAVIFLALGISLFISYALIRLRDKRRQP